MWFHFIIRIFFLNLSLVLMFHIHDKIQHLTKQQNKNYKHILTSDITNKWLQCNCSILGDPLTFHVEPPWTQTFYLSSNPVYDQIPAKLLRLYFVFRIWLTLHHQHVSMLTLAFSSKHHCPVSQTRVKEVQGWHICSRTVAIPSNLPLQL